MDDTQVIDWDVEEEEETERSSESLGCSLAPVGRLHIFSGTHGPERDFPLYLGKNVVGRSPDCSVVLPFPSISKQHAVIDISAWNKAPVLQDCGSLNGTQILRPPKVLSPGVSHRLRDQELILFADFPCQYHRLDVPLPLVSRGPLSVEETPRVQGGTQPSRLLLVEDSEEETDFSENCVAKKSRTTSSPLATVVPESDEEGPSPASGGFGPSFAFNLDSDTDEDEDQQSAAEEASAAGRKGATPAAEQSEAGGVTTDAWLVKAQPSVERHRDTEVEQVAGNVERNPPSGEDSDTDVDEGLRPPERPTEAHIEGTQPSGFLDSDTDGEAEGIPATSTVVPMKKRQIFHRVGTRGPGAPGLAHLQECPARRDTDLGQGKVLRAVPLETSHPSVGINSDTDDEEEVSAALTLARLKESGAALWNRDTNMEESRAKPVVLEQSHAASGRDSDTDVEEEKQETVTSSHTDEEGALVVACSEKGLPPLGDSDIGQEDRHSPGLHLERSQTSSTTVANTIDVEEVPPEPAVTHLKKLQVPVERTNQTDVEAKEGPGKLPVVLPEESRFSSSAAFLAAAGVRRSWLLAEGDAGAPWAAAGLKLKHTPKVGAQGRSPVAQVEQTVMHTHTPGEPAQPPREGTQTPARRERKPRVHGTKDCRDDWDDPEDLGLQATQCFVEREDESVEAVQSLEEEPTQAFLFTLPQEPGPSHCSFQTPGALDEPWEVLATQPFCPKEFAVSEPPPIATHLEARGSRPSPPRASPRDHQPESPVHTEPLGSGGRGMQTVQKDMGTPKAIESVTLERGPWEREVREQPPAQGTEDLRGEEELVWGPVDREQKHVLARDSQSQESERRVQSVNPEKQRASWRGEVELSKELQEKGVEKQTPAREVLENEVEKSVPETKGRPAGLEEPLDRGGTEGGSQDQKGQDAGQTPEPAVGPGALPGLASGAPVVSRSQSGTGRGALVSPRRQHGGHLNCKMPAAEKAAKGGPENPDVCLPPAGPEASAPPQNLLPSQSQTHPVPQPLFPPSPSKPPIPGARHSGDQEAPETLLASQLEPLHPKPDTRSRRSSRTVPSPLFSAAFELHPTTPIDQPVTSKPTSQGRTHRNSVRTPKASVSSAPELQPSTSTDQPVTPKPTSRATQGRTTRSSVRTPEAAVPTAPERQPSTSIDQPVTPKPTSQIIRGRANRSSVRTPKASVPTASECLPSSSTDQPVTPKPTSQITRGRANRSSVRTPEASVPTAPEHHPSTSIDQPVTPKPTSWATRGRTSRSSVTTPEAAVPTAPEYKPSTSTDHSVIPKSTHKSQATQGRSTRSSVRTPEASAPTAPEHQPSASIDQPVTRKPTSRATRSRINRSVRTSKAAVPTVPEHQPSTSTDQPVTPKPTHRATRGRTCKSSIETPQSVVPPAPDLESSTSTVQPVIPEATAQSRTLRSSSLSAAPVSTSPNFQSPASAAQPAPLEPVPQAGCSRKQRAAGKHSSFASPVVHKPGTAPPEPKSRSSRNQRPGAPRAAESLKSAPEPLSQPQGPTHTFLVPKEEVAGRSGFTPEPQPKASQVHKRTSSTMDSPPLPKRPQREVSQKAVFPKEEEDDAEKDPVIPGLGKRKRSQVEEEEPKGIPSRSLRRSKTNQESAAPKVLFTGVVDTRGQRAVLALGGSLAGSVTEASHLVTDRIRRTVKFLCALGRGIPILSLDWLHQSRKAGCFLSPDEYLVTDPEQEKNFGFSLRDSLSRARERRLLEGYEIHVTPGVQPPPAQMGEIISCCGGSVLSNMPRSYKPHRVVITCPQDFPRCSLPLRLGLPLLSPEFLLTGVLKQEAKPDPFVISCLEVSSI